MDENPRRSGENQRPGEAEDVARKGSDRGEIECIG